MARVTVERLREGTYRVTVEERDGETVHEVTAEAGDVERYARGTAPERLIRASFEFLLEHEPKEAILRRFDLPVIERYFPEYPRTIRRKLQENDNDVERTPRKT